MQELPHAFGEPPLTARLRASPEDFLVEEILGYDAEGAGEHLLLAAFAGVGIPVLMTKFGRDPALGSSVLITAMTDSGGFFIFLGLATIFLM